MLYYLYEWWAGLSDGLQDSLSPLRVLKYITVRAFLGAGTAFILSILLGPFLIRMLRSLKLGQYIRKDDAPTLGVLHGKKEGTPTMGGVLIVGSILVSTLIWAPITNGYVALTLATMVFMAWLGSLDDFAKIRQKHSRGIRARTKFMAEVAWALFIAGVLYMWPTTRDEFLQFMVPFVKTPVIEQMPFILAFLFLALILVGSSNAVNLTDGLDGLAVGCSGAAALAYLIMAYVAGHAMLAKYLAVPYVAGAGELAVFCGCLLGACLGFLWWNCHPAQVFMGDTGSLALGGSIAMVAILIKQEIVLAIVGGVFVMEAMSVIIQVLSFRLRGKRVFAMAPIHHHFEHRNWSETQVTIRFWIISIIFAILGVLTLKIR